jgi:excisionase family DNA binding protein
MSSSATTSPVPSPLALRPRDAARLLGISPRTLWGWTRDGIIPCVRVGTGKRKTVLYSVADLQAWLTRQAEVSEGGNDAPR